MVEVFWLLLDATKGSNTILPIHHPFWDQHRPGDSWLRSDVTEGNNCHCSLEATDEHPTAPPKGYELRGNGPQPGLNENPAKTGRLFAQSHPYFPQSCAQCAFYQGGAENGFRNQERDCEHCRFIKAALPGKNAQALPPKVEEYVRHGDAAVYCHPKHGENEVVSNLRLADLLSRKLKTDVYLLPRIHPDAKDADRLRSLYMPQGVPMGKNPDFLIGGRLFDGKSMMNINESGDRKKYMNVIQNRIKAAKKQADNVILEIPSFVDRKTIHLSVTDFLRQSNHKRTIIVVWKNKCLIYGNNKAPDD